MDQPITLTFYWATGHEMQTYWISVEQPAEQIKRAVEEIRERVYAHAVN